LPQQEAAEGDRITDSAGIEPGLPADTSVQQDLPPASPRAGNLDLRSPDTRARDRTGDDLAL